MLEYKTPFANGMAATTVIGQPDMTTASNGTSATLNFGFCGMSFDASGNLWAADPFNSRVLEFKTPFSNGMAASVVIGEPDFTSSSTGGGAAGMDTPSDTAFDSAGKLYITDISNNRVLLFAAPFTNGMSATAALG